ncbi:hypothetical protein BD779DRAFT_280336 [Infundibulicybe gibba]|nr:hypothetical protein BD779DRAFT_280336 [Infundibulicybe gibba]
MTVLVPTAVLVILRHHVGASLYILLLCKSSPCLGDGNKAAITYPTHASESDMHLTNEGARQVPDTHREGTEWRSIVYGITTEAGWLSRNGALSTRRGA